jgi:hypothetical protein
MNMEAQLSSEAPVSAHKTSSPYSFVIWARQIPEATNMWHHYESTANNDSPLSTYVLCVVCAASHYPCGLWHVLPDIQRRIHVSDQRGATYCTQCYMQRFVTVGHLQPCFWTSSLQHDRFIRYISFML